MKAIYPLSLPTLLLLSAELFAYGGGGGGKACTKPDFTDFTPAHLSEVANGANFSFIASKNTRPSSIKVTVKKIPTDINVTETPRGYKVTGKLPEELKETFARISIEAKTNLQCFGSSGWLVKITP